MNIVSVGVMKRLVFLKNSFNDGNGVTLAKTGSAQCAVHGSEAAQLRVPTIKRDIRLSVFSS